MIALDPCQEVCSGELSSPPSALFSLWLVLTPSSPFFFFSPWLGGGDELLPLKHLVDPLRNHCVGSQMRHFTFLGLTGRLLSFPPILPTHSPLTVCKEQPESTAEWITPLGLMKPFFAAL